MVFPLNIHIVWAKIGEALLMGISAILLGVDAMLQWYEDEAKSLSANLGLLLTVSIMVCNAYYLQICTEDDAICDVIGRDGVEAIATGYLIIFWVSLIYIILYICTCCTCDCKDKCIIRVILAVALVVGGVLCSIGYYVYSGGFDAGNWGILGNSKNKKETQNPQIIKHFMNNNILIIDIACGYQHNLVIDNNGNGYSWGNNYRD